ncbi:uncharacterized protein BXZ73DRAFT_14533, partial [Epithele typhae]|uniref:uncharacterized protein n=1 Tax=Epithele typhae TaxID=378194 RepID=UPI002008B3DB
MHHKDYEIWISCEGTRLPEYDVTPEGNDGKTFGCYIPSESGKTFKIEWLNALSDTHLRYVITIDGRDAGGNRCMPGDKGMRWGVRTSPMSRRPFKFAELQTTDEDVSDSVSHAALGEIQVAVSRIRAEVRAVPHTKGKFQPVGPVNERCKKGGVHCTSLGETVRIKKAYTQTYSTPLDPAEGDIAVFIFRYRPLALLQAQGIVPDEDVKRVQRGCGEPVQDLLGVLPRGIKRPRDPEDSDAEDVKPRVKAERFEGEIRPKVKIEPRRTNPIVVQDDVKAHPEAEGAKPNANPVAASDIGSESEVEDELEDLQSQMDELRRKMERVERRR